MGEVIIGIARITRMIDILDVYMRGISVLIGMCREMVKVSK